MDISKIVEAVRNMDGVQFNAFVEKLCEDNLGRKLCNLIDVVEMDKRMPLPQDYKDRVRSMIDLNWDGSESERIDRE